MEIGAIGGQEEGGSPKSTGGGLSYRAQEEFVEGNGRSSSNGLWRAREIEVRSKR